MIRQASAPKRIGAALLAGNVLAWGVAAWALTPPVLLGTAFLAYGLGLRHAVDADHIAAIDNVTRKFLEEGRKPFAVGLFFALGHSTVVFLATVGVALSAVHFKEDFARLHAFGELTGALISGVFLLVIGAVNAVLLAATFQRLRRAKANAGASPLQAGGTTSPGSASRWLRPILRGIRSSWQMYPVGFLFGLGFDTSTEIAVLSLSAMEAVQGLPLWHVLVLPLLFAAGMTLVDKAQGIMMTYAYDWAFVAPARKVYYNLAVTGLSVAVAFTVGTAELMGLVRERPQALDAIFRLADFLNSHPGAAGLSLVAAFSLLWVAFRLFTPDLSQRECG